MTAEQVVARRNGYDPRAELDRDLELARVIDLVSGGTFASEEPGVFAPLVRSLVEHDPFFVLADFRAYVECQREVSRLWADERAWARASILDAARMGRFGSDRSMRDYVARIWKAPAVPITMG